MSEIPDDVTQQAHDVVRAAQADCREMKLLLGTGSALDLLEKHIAIAILAAEQRGAERERERVAAVLLGRGGFMTAVDGDGAPYVRFRFATLGEMQDFHRALFELSGWARAPQGIGHGD